MSDVFIYNFQEIIIVSVKLTWHNVRLATNAGFFLFPQLLITLKKSLLCTCNKQQKEDKWVTPISLAPCLPLRKALLAEDNIFIWNCICICLSVV